VGHSRLTARQEAFAQAYWLRRNGAEAYRLAYQADRCSPATIHRRAHALLQNGKVEARLREFQDAANTAFADTARRVVEEVSTIAFSDVGALLDDQGRFRPPEVLPAATRRAIEQIKVRHSPAGPVVTAVRLADKLRALDLLARLTGALEQPSGGDAALSRMSDAQIEEELRQLDVADKRLRASGGRLQSGP